MHNWLEIDAAQQMIQSPLPLDKHGNRVVQFRQLVTASSAATCRFIDSFERSRRPQLDSMIFEMGVYMMAVVVNGVESE